ncbi:MAG: hypothetical protein R2716_10240 [Microthrixaceae bacterium]
MIVIDASAAVLALMNDAEARSMLTEESAVCPHLADPRWPMRSGRRCCAARWTPAWPSAWSAYGSTSGSSVSA